MGLDISVVVDNYEDVFDKNYHQNDDENFNKHSLSRTFCNFICRKEVIETEPELDQIGKIVAVDISAIYEMENYVDIEELAEYIDEDESEDEIIKAELNNTKLEGNIKKFLNTVSELISKLNEIENLPKLLLNTEFDTLNNDVYFSSFTIDKGKGYIDNNFGQDLRNFKNFLEYCLKKETKTVWFVFG
ncbi:hypothetical protein HNP99_003552 [Flavobacterium sp. 28A]|uniref:hypothetical protein n=1 Tax=Flavobacterium sp. 28A TaxID=2735895 RepID=UPI00156D66B2|nr:hypothetical protein [Flavobacterium sp. 28A]NRT17173.1 hypothetical protein [Flavobacterium sp. 28A]